MNKFRTELHRQLEDLALESPEMEKKLNQLRQAYEGNAVAQEVIDTYDPESDFMKKFYAYFFAAENPEAAKEARRSFQAEFPELAEQGYTDLDFMSAALRARRHQEIR